MEKIGLFGRGREPKDSDIIILRLEIRMLRSHEVPKEALACAARLTCQQVCARECARARELERERTRVRVRERTCMQEAAQEREAARACVQKTVKKIGLRASKKSHSLDSKKKDTIAC